MSEMSVVNSQKRLSGEFSNSLACMMLAIQSDKKRTTYKEKWVYQPEKERERGQWSTLEFLESKDNGRRRTSDFLHSSAHQLFKRAINVSRKNCWRFMTFQLHYKI